MKVVKEYKHLGTWAEHRERTMKAVTVNVASAHGAFRPLAKAILTNKDFSCATRAN